MVPVCQAFEYGKYLGHIDIQFTLQEGTGRGSNDRYVINQRSDITVSFWFSDFHSDLGVMQRELSRVIIFLG